MLGDVTNILEKIEKGRQEISKFLMDQSLPEEDASGEEEAESVTPKKVGEKNREATETKPKALSRESISGLAKRLSADIAAPESGPSATTEGDDKPKTSIETSWVPTISSGMTWVRGRFGDARSNQP
ncbi:hypothetical protein PoB_005311800 [Plakobranchus ocellatus]|uniref:Uncharacterized protein n=1 Tax=Plakobranchus ocellatus TaxID=259542 RepID=A0AAV4C5C1_9GAST|nr:hypothetical protein PoB_005311800 [Plakobranchus ocellatus]